MLLIGVNGHHSFLHSIIELNLICRLFSFVLQLITRMMTLLPICQTRFLDPTGEKLRKYLCDFFVFNFCFFGIDMYRVAMRNSKKNSVRVTLKEPTISHTNSFPASTTPPPPPTLSTTRRSGRHAAGGVAKGPASAVVENNGTVRRKTRSSAALGKESQLGSGHYKRNFNFIIFFDPGSNSYGIGS